MSGKDFTADIAAGFGAFLPAEPIQPEPIEQKAANTPAISANDTQKQAAAAGIDEIIRGLARVPKKENSTRRVSLILPPSLVAEMKDTCTEYGLSLNAAAALAFRLFLEEMKKKDDKTL